MDLKAKINGLFIIAAINFLMLIYLIILVTTNQSLINKNKGLISSNTSLIKTSK